MERYILANLERMFGKINKKQESKNMEEKIRKQIEELKYFKNTEHKSDKARKLVFTYDEVLEQKIKLLESLLGE